MEDGTPDGTLMGPGNNQDQPGNPPAWMAQLPDDLKTNEGLTKFATIGELGKSYIELDGKLDGTIRVPGENATDAERASFYNSLGRPEQPDGYKFDEPKLPEGIEYDAKAVQDFREFAHKHGLTQGQASAVHDLYHQMFSAGITEYEGVVAKQREEAETELKKEWGDKFDGNIELAKRALKQFGGDEVVAFMDQSGLGNNPLIVKLFNRIGAAMSEDKLQSGDINSGGEERPRTVGGTPMLDFPSMEDKK